MPKDKWKVVTDEDREYFECDCHDPEHIMRVEHLKSKDEDGDIFLDELSFNFRTLIGDWEANYSLGKYTTDFNYAIHEWANKFRRMKWRFKMAFRILIKGNFQLHDQWIPERRGADDMRGQSEMSKLLLWLAEKHIEISKRQIEFGKMSTEALKEYKEFAEKWSMHSFKDDEETA
jgi:hypothetical protein